MQAITVCTKLRSQLEKGQCCGTVYNVFEHSASILSDTGLVTILTPDRGMYPWSIKLGEVTSIYNLGMESHMVANLSREQFCIPASGLTIRLSMAEETDLGIHTTAYTADSTIIRSYTVMIAEQIKRSGKTAGMAPLITGTDDNIFTMAIAPRLAPLKEAIISRDAARAKYAATQLAGCGIGVTPSSDDMLTGYFILLYGYAFANCDSLLQRILKAAAYAAAERTGVVSGAFLRQAGDGLASEYVLDLLTSILGGEDKNTVAANVCDVLDIGSTSGADILTGIVLAMKDYFY